MNSEEFIVKAAERSSLTTAFECCRIGVPGPQRAPGAGDQTPNREQDLQQERKMPYQCQLIDRPAQPALVIRTRASVQMMSQVLGPAWGAIMQHAGQSGVHPSGPPYVAYHNMDMQDLDLEIGFPFVQQLQGEGEVLAGEIPAGQAAECLHIGPYDQLGAAYEALQQWMTANGYTPSGVAYEFYLNDPQSTPAVELQTQIMFPLA